MLSLFYYATGLLSSVRHWHCRVGSMRSGLSEQTVFILLVAALRDPNALSKEGVWF
jgi:hypothetical protein